MKRLKSSLDLLVDKARARLWKRYHQSEQDRFLRVIKILDRRFPNSGMSFDK